MKYSTWALMHPHSKYKFRQVQIQTSDLGGCCPSGLKKRRIGRGVDRVTLRSQSPNSKDKAATGVTAESRQGLGWGCVGGQEAVLNGP